MGLIPFDSGTITIDGHNIETEPMEAKRIYSYVPDNPELYTFMRGIDYLNFIADIFELDYDTRKRGIDTLSKDFDIHNRLGEPIESYSHGMQQKLALIGALLHDPKLIVLDEPFVGLDPLATKKFANILSVWQKIATRPFYSPPTFWKWRKNYAIKSPSSAKDA